MILLPIDIIRYIIEYIDDADVRRYFGVYNKINLLKYNLLNSITNFTIEKINYYRDSFYYLKKINKSFVNITNNNVVVKIQIKIKDNKKFVFYDITIDYFIKLNDRSYAFTIFNDNFLKY